MRRTALAFAPVALALPFPLRCPSCRAVPCAVPPLPLLTRCGPFACQGVTLCTDVFIWHNCLQRRPSCCSTSSRATSSRSYSPQGHRHAEYIQSELLATRSSARRVHPVGATRHKVIGTQSTSRSCSPQGHRHAEYIQSELLATRSSARRVHPVGMELRTCCAPTRGRSSHLREARRVVAHSYI